MVFIVWVYVSYNLGRHRWRDSPPPIIMSIYTEQLWLLFRNLIFIVESFAKLNIYPNFVELNICYN